MHSPRTWAILAAAAATITTLTAAPVAGGTMSPAAVGAAGPAASASILADGTVVPLQVTGPPEQRLNLVVLGDGYTESELPDFRADVDKHLNVLWSIDPFRSYRNYINVYMIEVVSNESGISCDPDEGNVRRDTALNLEYAATCPADPNARGITFGPGGREAPGPVRLSRHRIRTCGRVRRHEAEVQAASLRRDELEAGDACDDQADAREPRHAVLGEIYSSAQSSALQTNGESPKTHSLVGPAQSTHVSRYQRHNLWHNARHAD